MLYNHKQFRKNSDKKIMRKVKKNWVILSVASFSLIGATAIIQSNQNLAYASETQVSANSNTNQNNSTIDNQKSDAKSQLDAESSKIKDDINNDSSLSQSDKDSQKAEVDSYKVVGEQSIDSATDVNSINQALSDGKNNIDASHVAGQNSTDSNASSNASSSADQSAQSSGDNQSQQSGTSSTSSGDSLTSSSSSSDDSNSGLSFRDGSSDAPQDSDTYISGPKKDYSDATANTKLKYTGVTYDYTTGNYVINFQFGSKVITKTGGANRVLEFAINTSPNLSNKVNQVTVTNADGTRMLTNNNGQYYVKYSTGKVVGGNIDIAVYVNPVKVTPGDWISAFMSTHREHSDGSLWNYSTEIAFSSTRSLTYNQFGNDFNSQLLSQLRFNELYDLNQTSPLNQTTQLINNYTSQINAITTDGDFISQLNSIQNSYRADNSSLSNAITQLNNQSTTSTNNVSNLASLSSNDKQSANNSIMSAFQTSQSNLMGISQSSQISGILSDGINSIKKIELQATIKSAINDINNAATDTTNRIQSDNTLDKDKVSQQVQNVVADKNNYTSQLQAVSDAANIAAIRNQGVNKISSEYVPGPAISSQRTTAKSQLNDEANKIKAAIDSDNTLTSNEKTSQKKKVDDVNAAAQAKIDTETTADGINDALNQGKRDIDSAHATSTTTLADKKSKAKAQLDAEATKIRNDIENDATLTQEQKNDQIDQLTEDKSTAEQAIDNAQDVDGISKSISDGILNMDADHQPGQSVDSRKSSAKSQLNDDAAKIKQAIANDSTLTQDQKSAQMAQLATDKAAAEQAIDNAQNADDVNQAISDGNTKMAKDHQAGDSIESQKSSAKQAIQAEANKVKAAIDADSSLTGTEKEQQKNAVDSAANADQANIDGLTNADDINASKNHGIQDVDGKHVSGTPLDTQKSTAKSQITNEANKIKQAIENDTTLTQAEKNAQTAKVNADADAASKAIDNASDADSVNKAISDGTSNIDNDHVSKAPVDSQRLDALNQLDAQAAKVKQAIANDSTLTQAQKDVQTAKVDADASAGKQAIQNATDADSINKALSDNSGKIANDHQPGSSVDNQKDSNNTNLDAEATKVKNQIDADVSLTGKEKDQQKSNVESVKAAAEDKINAATNADGIKSAYDQGIKDIDAQYVPGKTSLPDQKTNAKAQLDAQAAKIKQDIANDSTLTQIEKNEQSAMVDADKDSAETAIDNALDADAVNQAISDGNQKITSDHKPGKSIDEQKADAKASIQAEATKIKSEIDADLTLTSDEKAAQKNKVDSVSAADQDKIDGLTNVDDIHNQITQSVKDIDDVHKSGKSLSDQKSDAKSQLDAQAAKIKQDIASDATLTQAEKDAQSAKVDADTNAGKQAIDNAADADSINGLIKDNKDKIAADHVSHASVDDQKASNKKALDDQAAKVKQDIANDNTLTQAEKDAQTAKVDADKEAAEKDIDAATDAEGIKKATDAGNDQINKDHVPGKSVDDQKAAAKKSLEDQAAKIKQDIANDATLTQSEKNAQSAKVDADRDAGEKAIDGAKDADDINKLISDTTTKINGDHTSGQSVADQKTSKKNDLDNEANKVKAAIDADNTLSQAEKDAQKAAIDADVDAGKKAIDAAKDAEGIKQAVDSSNQKVDGEHKSGKSVADQKSDAKSQMDAEANKVKAAIDADDTLTSAEKAQQKKNVDDANKAAQAKIDDASNADEVNGAIKDGNTKIDDQHKQGTSVKDQQDAAKKQLDAEADKIKQDIDNDPTLSKSDKDAQKAKVDNDTQAGKDAIDKQSNADGINQAIVDAKKAIDEAHKSGTPLSDQKKTAQDQLNAQAAKIKQDIDNDATLTSDQKKAQKANIDQDVTNGMNAINSATDADGINDALSDANSKVAGEHQSKDSVDKQKGAAKKQLEAQAAKTKNDIQNDDTLTTEQKKAQSANVDSDLTSAENAVDEDTDADSINKAISDGNGKIASDHNSGTPVDTQKSNAKAQLDAEATKVKNTIDADNTLTNDEKSAQKAKVDDDVKSGKDAIENSADADSINGLVKEYNGGNSDNEDKGKIASEHVPSKVSLQHQKSNAKKQLDDQATKVKNDIANDVTLTKAEKDAQTAQVEADKTAAEKAIDNASDAEGVKEATDNGNKNISSDHNSGKSVDDQKSDAKKQLEAQATKVKKDIQNDVTLTQAQRDAQIAKVDADKFAAENAVDDATDADSINKAIADGNNKITSDHVKGTPIDTQKSNAKAQLDAEATKVKNTIDADNTLTSDEKKAQKAKVDDEVKAGKDAIDEATNADNINALIKENNGDNSNEGKIASDHVLGPSVDAQKSAAKQQLEAQVAKIKNDIQSDATLTQAQRNSQSAKVDADKTAAEKAVDDATDADSINKAIDDGNKNISNDHQSGTSVDTQKSNAKAQLDAEATNVKNDIDADNTLTSDEKDVQKAKVDADVKAGKEAIDNSTEADSINKAVSDTNAQVDKKHVSGTPVDSQKYVAKKQLEDQATKTKQGITNDATLTQSEKDAQIAKVEADKTAGEKAIDDATDADTINQALVDCNKQISADHVPGKSLSDQKDAAKKQLDAEAEKTKATIDADKTLTSAEKAQQKANVDAKDKAAQDNVDAQTNADNINKLTAQGVEEIDAQYVPGKVSLSAQKTNAKAKLEEEATKVKNDILNDATLTKAEKDAQISNVDADKAAGEKAIDDAIDADGINQAVSDSNAKMDADYVPGKTSLPDQKSNAKAQLDAKAAKVKNDIANDATLTQSEKDAQMAQVDADKAAAEQAIDNAPDADGINQYISNGNTKIASDYVPGKPVDDQKSAAKSDLDAKAAKVKNDIANDATLTQSEKDAQMAKVDADKADGEQAIDNATDADSINQIISHTNAKIDADHVSSQSVDDQKVAAKDAINNEANKIKAAIDADKTLSKAEKQRQKNNVDRAQAAAQAAIDGLTNADDINSAIAQQIKIIDAQHVKKQNNGSGPEQTIPRNIYMVKNFYRYLSTNFTKKNRVQGYKATSRPNAVMFRIIGETTNKNGVKRYKVYQIVVKKNGSFKVDRKKWGYITAKPSYMRPLYYRSNVQQIKVIGRGIREYKNVKLSKAVKGYKHGTVLNVKAVKKYGSTYRLQLTNGHYITANKNLVRKQTTPRNVYMVKGFYRYSSVNFSHKNRIQGYKKQARPNAVMFRIVGETTNNNGLKRYKVYQIVPNKKGLFRVDYKKWGYITTKLSYVKPLYYSSKVRSVRVIGSRIRAYKNIKLTKSVKSYKRGTVLNVKAVKKVGTTYRLQLTNGSYISANKNLVQKIK
ncbi:hypothetical protein HW41_03165 [Apilactobacillus kunkeei]|uniref:DUF1542 domain-containing protein n=1 Tax=Apilactobacillus kunkeei TaxID=148814 RepID=UPI00059B50EE|nr:DUF1542 domain-containing protein [Apilactobacillus kunkeei]KIM18782.1 hypothetical protein HW41_03165 [Apilactobacillus kunkeei]